MASMTMMMTIKITKSMIVSDFDHDKGDQQSSKRLNKQHTSQSIN